MANIPLAPPIAPALALTQGVLEVMYDLAQWAAWQHRGTRVSVKRAHKKLAALRAAMAPGTTVTEQIRDLGRDQEILDYISCRDDAQEIIGSGITKLEAAFLNCVDRNTHMPRFDFLVSRADGSCVRLHPSSIFCIITVGVREAWLHPDSTEALPAQTRGQLAVARSFSNIHQQDHISARQARAYLQWIMGSWYDLPHPRPRFYRVDPPFTGAQKNEKFIH